MGIRAHSQVIATLLATMLLALIPLANAARAWHEHLVRHAENHDSGPHRYGSQCRR